MTDPTPEMQAAKVAVDVAMRVLDTAGKALRQAHADYKTASEAKEAAVRCLIELEHGASS
jgi:hypothetical protein